MSPIKRYRPGKRGAGICGGDSGGPLIDVANELIEILRAAKEVKEQKLMLFGLQISYVSSRTFGSPSLADPEVRSFVQGYLN
jgi:S1-C subfamily serine protease